MITGQRHGTLLLFSTLPRLYVQTLSWETTNPLGFIYLRCFIWVLNSREEVEISCHRYSQLWASESAHLMSQKNVEPKVVKKTFREFLKRKFELLSQEWENLWYVLRLWPDSINRRNLYIFLGYRASRGLKSFRIPKKLL